MIKKILLAIINPQKYMININNLTELYKIFLIIVVTQPIMIAINWSLMQEYLTKQLVELNITDYLVDERMLALVLISTFIKGSLGIVLIACFVYYTLKIMMVDEKLKIIMRIIVLSSIPIAFRNILEGVLCFITKKYIWDKHLFSLSYIFDIDGLSGVVLSFFDIFRIWMIVMLIIGLRTLGLKGKKLVLCISSCIVIYVMYILLNENIREEIII